MYSKFCENIVLQNTETFENIYNPEFNVSHLQMDEFVKISIVIDGVGIRKSLGDEDECRTGDLYIYQSGVPHGFFAKSETEQPTVISLMFNPSQVLEPQFCDPQRDQYCYGVFRNKQPMICAMLNSEVFCEVKKIYETIALENTKKDLEWGSAIKSNLVLLLITLARYINLAKTEKNVHSKEWVIVSAATKEVLDNCHDPDMTLEAIAQKLYISKSHLSRMFSRVTGESFVDYVRNVRISLACKLLTTTSLTNEEIVRQCGLRDVPSFYKLFKGSRGMTPYQYRMTTKTQKRENLMSTYLEISENLQRGKAKIVKELVTKAVNDGLPVNQILNDALIFGMNIIGEKFKNNEVYVPEVLVAARAMNVGMQILKPLLIEDGIQSAGKVCIGTVQGDLHDIGKNLVKMMMEGKGLEVVDLGVDVAPETFVEVAIKEKCQVVCCSALLTTTMDVMSDVVKAFENAGVRDKVKIMVGGAPITEEFCTQIGADRYTSDAASAADAAVELCKC